MSFEEKSYRRITPRKMNRTLAKMMLDFLEGASGLEEHKQQHLMRAAITLQRKIRIPIATNGPESIPIPFEIINI